MAEDTSEQILTESELIAASNALLAAITEAKDTYRDAITQLATHEVDEAAHPFIQDKIQSIIDGTGFTTPEQVEAIISGAITAHDESSSSHATLVAAIAALTVKVTELTARVDILDPAASEDPTTAFAAALAAIDALYDPIINSLKLALEAATANGLDTVDDIAAAIQTNTTAKAAARYAVMQEYGYYA